MPPTPVTTASGRVTDAAPGIITAAVGVPAREAASGHGRAASASDLLLWLYERVDLPPTDRMPPSVVARFRALASTD